MEKSIVESVGKKKLIDFALEVEALIEQMFEKGVAVEFEETKEHIKDKSKNRNGNG